MRLRARYWLAAEVLGIVAALAFAVLERSTIGRSLAVAARAHWLWVVSTVELEIISIITFGCAQGIIFEATGGRISIPSMAATATVGNAISFTLPLIGPGAGTAFTYQRLIRFGGDPAAATWALGTAWLLSSVVWGFMLAIGAAFSGNPAASISGLIVASAILLFGTACILVLHLPHVRHGVGRIATRLVALTTRLSRHQAAPSAEGFDLVLTRFLSARITRGRWIRALGLSAANWAAGAACLITAILAVRAAVPWSKALLIYCAGATASSFNLTPGGLGVVEGTLTAGLVAAGLPSKSALGAVFIFRMVTFWLAIVLGWSVYAFIRGARSSAPGRRATRASHVETPASPPACST